jgi:putative redox protein
MDSKVIWQSGVTFNGVTGSGFKVPMDTSIEHGGTNSGPTPMELVLTGLGGCTAMDVITILHKKKQDVTNFEIYLHADRATDHPMVFTDITVEFVVTGRNIDEVAVNRAVELSETKYCSVNAMLRKTATIHTKVTVKEIEN